MASTPPTTFARGPVPSSPARSAPSLVPSGARRQRRWSLALLALLVTLGSALAFVVLWLNAGSRVPVLALRRDVPAGQVIQADDLTVVRISTDPGISPVSSSARDDVIGQPAASDLQAGTLLVPDAVGNNEGLASIDAVIAIPVPVDQFAELETGNRVTLWRAASTGDVTDGDLLGEGRVFSVRSEEDGGTDIRVLVKVNESLLPQIVAAVQADQIQLVRGGS
jgi:hypothetical protein